MKSTKFQIISTDDNIIKPLDDKNCFCSVCKIPLQKCSVKRHVKEVHLNQKEICPICNKCIKRLAPHMDLHYKKMQYSNKDSNFPSVIEVNSINSDREKPINNFISLYDDSIYDILIKKYKKDFSIYDKCILIFKNFKLGCGSHGKSFFGLDKKTKKPIAVKAYEIDNSKYQIREIQILEKIEKYEIFPKVLKEMNDEYGYYLAQELIGIDLYRLLKFENNCFDPSTILNISIDILTCLKYLNEQNIVHCDLKGDNYVWNCFNDKNIKSQVILIDFSCSVISKNQIKVKRIGYNSFSSLVQTLEELPDSKDEIESLIYSLMELSHIELPWFNQNFIDSDEKKITFLKEKNNFSIEKYLPEDLKILGLIFNDVKRKSKNDKIDFNFYIDLLTNQKNKIKEEYNIDYRFSWEKKIKNILIESKLKGDISIIEDKVCKVIFDGFPNEFIIDFLNKYFKLG